jgi:hypothetical protein
MKKASVWAGLSMGDLAAAGVPSPEAAIWEAETAVDEPPEDGANAAAEKSEEGFHGMLFFP